MTPFVFGEIRYAIPPYELSLMALFDHSSRCNIMAAIGGIADIAGYAFNQFLTVEIFSPEFLTQKKPKKFSEEICAYCSRELRHGSRTWG